MLSVLYWPPSLPMPRICQSMAALCGAMALGRFTCPPLARQTAQEGCRLLNMLIKARTYTCPDHAGTTINLAMLLIVIKDWQAKGWRVPAVISVALSRSSTLPTHRVISGLCQSPTHHPAGICGTHSQKAGDIGDPTTAHTANQGHFCQSDATCWGGESRHAIHSNGISHHTWLVSHSGKAIIHDVAQAIGRLRDLQNMHLPLPCPDASNVMCRLLRPALTK